MNAPLLPVLPGYDNPQLIAHGTTALVFRAIQTRLNRSVAIKVITADTGSIPVNAARELATTVALSSQPHIVSIIDTGVTDDDRPYIVMEYCEGGSYAQILRHDGLLPVDDVLEVGIKIGEALHAAHQAGIVHRDVKPSNILRSRFGPALTDFGIARAPEELGATLTREMMTPHHASPEALLHQAQSGISDIYSLASTMWTLLIGHPPFVDPTKPPLDMYAFRDRVLHDPLPSMTREDVPAWLIRELDRAMSKLPAGRHRTALEFADALRRGALGLPPATVIIPATAPVPAAGPTVAPPPTSPRYPWGGAAEEQPVSGPLYIPSARPPEDAAELLGTPLAGTGGGDRRTGGGWANQVHVPGMPAQAWPAPQPDPIGMPAPPSATATRTPAARTAVDGWPPPRFEEQPDAGPQPRPDVRPEARHDTWLDARPEARSDLDEDAGEPDGGGWLGPATPPRPATDAMGLPEPGALRRFDDLDLLAPPTRQRRTLVAVVIGVAVMAVAVVAIAGTLIMALVSRDNSPSSVGGDIPGASPTRFISAQAEGQPRDIRITEDRGTALTLTWTDPTAGTVTFVVVGSGPDGEKLDTKPIPRGTHTATYTQLSPNKNYCFVVGAVYAVDSIALAPRICTNR